MNLLKFFKAMLTSVPRLAPHDCAARVRSGDALLVDVREPAEWAEGVAQQATLLSLADLNGTRTDWKPFLAANAGREILLYCAVGGRAGLAARVLAAEGFRVANTGGLSDWAASGWPIVKPAATGN
ncbi:MAG: rhodanese-like domain-containing protein [Verrucomicrobia bacterium]|nr:rhodanese-like domain-containing protein [Verrucomicrobiota bacterium]